MRSFTSQPRPPAASPVPEAGMIDMTRTMPPNVDGFARYIQEALSRVALLDDLEPLIKRHRFFGTETERTLVSEWLSKRLGFQPDIGSLNATGGTQNALKILLPRLVEPGRCVASETLSYAGTTVVCRLFGIPVVGVPIDDLGIIPDEFATVCQRDRPAVLYCNPTIHNPTTSILPETRRREIASIARRFSVTIIEDDVHGMIVPDAPPPIASVAPDITWYIMSVSKCIGMGLRVAFLVAPDAPALAQLRAPVQSISAWFVPGLSMAVVADLIRSGAADEIARGVRQEVEARQAIATRALEGHDFRSHRNALHLWLALSENWTAAKLSEAVRPFNVLVRPSDLFNTGEARMPNFVRLSLVAPKSRDDLQYAMEMIANQLSNSL